MAASALVNGLVTRLEASENDPRVALEIAQTITSEIHLPSLLALIMGLSLEWVGADTGCVLLWQDNTWMVVAEGQRDRVPSVRLRTAYLHDYADVRPEVVRTVTHTRKRFVSHDVEDNGETASNRSEMADSEQATLCVPLLNQQRVTGLLYLQRSSDADAFESGPMLLLDLYSGLMAAAIENARFVQDLRQTQPQPESQRTNGDDHQQQSSPVEDNPSNSGSRHVWSLAEQRARLAASDLNTRMGRIREQTDKVRLSTMLMQAEMAEARFRALLEAAPDAIVISNRDGRIVLVNRQAETMFGFDRTMLEGHSIDVLMPDDVYDTHHEQRQESLSHDNRPEKLSSSAGTPLLGRRSDGSLFHIEVHKSVIAAFPRAQVVSIIRDVTRHAEMLQALQESERFTHATIDALADHICVVDENGVIVAVNQAWRQFAAENGANAHRVGVGTDYLAVCEGASGPDAYEARAFAGGIRAVMRGDQDEFVLEYPCHSPDTQRWYVGRVSRFSGAGPVRLVVAHHDVTPLKRAVLALREAKNEAEASKREEAKRRHEAERRRQIAESLRDVLAILNSDRPLGDVLDYIAQQSRQLLSGQATAIFRLGDEPEWIALHAEHGLPRDALITQRIPVCDAALNAIVMSHDAVAIPDVSNVPADLAGEMRDGETPAFLVPVIDSYRAVLAIPLLIKEEVYGGLVLYDAEPRPFSSEEMEVAVLFADQAVLAIENSRLKEQAERGATIAERNRLARDLHDAVTQAIFAANLIADSLPRVWELHPQEGRRGLEELRQLTRGALSEMRSLLLELQPTALLKKPLPDLLAQMIEAVSSRTRIPIELTCEGTRALPPEVHVALYRIAQEALNNIAKHAGAQHVAVHLRFSNQRVLLCVVDDGCGFHPGEITADHLGINGMRERARGIGATCRISSRPGHGTHVFVRWLAPPQKVDASVQMGMEAIP